MSQLSFEFDPPQGRNAPPAVADAAQPLTREDMARLLDQHPDFKVLRRLVPVLDYGPLAPVGTDVQPQAAVRVLILETETTGLDTNGKDYTLALKDIDKRTKLATTWRERGRTLKPRCAWTRETLSHAWPWRACCCGRRTFQMRKRRWSL